MINAFLETFYYTYDRVHENIYFLLWVISFLWIIQILNALSGYRLNYLGIYPRTPQGLIGIFFSPLLHGNFQHLFLNSIPLLVLGSLVLVAGSTFFFKLTFFISLISGLIVWLLGRPAYHIGASALVLGYWGFILFNAYESHSMLAIFLGLLCLYYFSGLIVNLFPQEEKVSWEGHLAGFLAGISMSYLLAHHYIH